MADQPVPPSFPRPTGPVRPSSYLRPEQSQPQRDDQQQRGSSGGSGALKAPPAPMDIVDREQQEALRAIRQFLKVRTSYDVLPVSFRLIILDTSLLVNKSLAILVQNGIVSAPLWDSKRSRFAGLLTSSDYINVIQYYWQYPEAMREIDKFRLDSLRDVEKAIGAKPPETLSIHPMKPLYEACRRMLRSRARRIPLVDLDDETRQEMVVSVLTQYRILRFVAVNVKETGMLRKPLGDIGVGTYEGISTASMDTPVMDVIHTLVRKKISSVPIVDANGIVLNIYEAVDILTLIKNGTYDELSLTVGEALLKRPEDFPGVHTCSEHDRLDTIFDAIRRGRVHRLIVVDGENRLKGIVTLSDILQYLLLEGEGGDNDGGGSGGDDDADEAQTADDAQGADDAQIVGGLEAV